MSRKTSEGLNIHKHNDDTMNDVDSFPDQHITAEEFKTLLAQVKGVSLQKTHNLKQKYSKYKDLARELATRLSEEEFKCRQLQEKFSSKEEELEKVKIAVVKLHCMLSDVLGHIKPTLEGIKKDILQLAKTEKSQCQECASLDCTKMNRHADGCQTFKKNALDEANSPMEPMEGEHSQYQECIRPQDEIEELKRNKIMPQSHYNSNDQGNHTYQNISSNSKYMQIQRGNSHLQKHSFLSFSSQTLQTAYSPCCSLSSRQNPQPNRSSFTSASSCLPRKSLNSFLSPPQQQLTQEFQKNQTITTATNHSKLQLRKQAAGSSRKAYPSFHEDMQMSNTTITPSSRGSENNKNTSLAALSFQSALSQHTQQQQQQQQPTLSKYHNRSTNNNCSNNTSLPSTSFQQLQSQQQRQHSVSNHITNSQFSLAQSTPLSERNFKYVSTSATKGWYSPLGSSALRYSQLNNCNNNNNRESNSAKSSLLLTASTKWSTLFAQLSKRSISGLKQQQQQKQQQHACSQYEPTIQTNQKQSSRIMRN